MTTFSSKDISKLSYCDFGDDHRSHMTKHMNEILVRIIFPGI